MARVVWAAVLTSVAGVVLSLCTAGAGWFVVVLTGVALSAFFLGAVWRWGPHRRLSRNEFTFGR